MNKESSDRFLFVTDSQKRKKKSRLSKPSRYTKAKTPVRFGDRSGRRKYRRTKSRHPVSVCEYGIYPENQPMNIDDFKFDLRGKFLERLNKLYYDISEQGKKISIKTTKDKEPSPKLFIRDILTEYTVKNIFDIQTQNKLLHIINTIIKTLYDKFYEETGIRLFFIYRGGNILKIYKNSFESILPGIAREIFDDEFGKYFKNSDIDFYTVVENRDKFKDEELYTLNIYIQMMCYYGVYIARIFIMNNFNLFEYCSLNNTALDIDFDHLLDKMNEEKMKSESSDVQNTKFVGLGFNEFVHMKDGYKLSDVLSQRQSKIIPSDLQTWKQYKQVRNSGKRDININPVEEQVEINTIDYIQPPLFKIDFTKYMKELIHKNKILEYYISNNNQISSEGYVDFSLVRLMINFVVIYQRHGKYGITNGPSELFDLSIGRPRDKSYNLYKKDALTLYRFEYENGLEDQILIPKIETTILDLINILFFYNVFPWEDEKYEKRLYRLMILIFVKQISNHTLPQMEKILLSNKKTKYEDGKEDTFETLSYRNEELKTKMDKKQKKKFKEYINKYNEIIKKLLKVVERLRIFVDSDNQITEREIYKFI